MHLNRPAGTVGQQKSHEIEILLLLLLLLRT